MIDISLNSDETMFLLDRDKMSEIYHLFDGVDHKVGVITLAYTLANEIVRLCDGIDESIFTAESIAKLVSQVAGRIAAERHQSSSLVM